MVLNSAPEGSIFLAFERCLPMLTLCWFARSALRDTPTFTGDHPDRRGHFPAGQVHPARPASGDAGLRQWVGHRDLPGAAQPIPGAGHGGCRRARHGQWRMAVGLAADDHAGAGGAHHGGDLGAAPISAYLRNSVVMRLCD